MSLIILDTPFQLLLLYFPFSLLSDPQLARAIYTLILELALFALAILSLRLTDWEAPRFFTILFIFFAVFNFYSFQAIYEASPVLMLGFLYAEILFTLRARNGRTHRRIDGVLSLLLGSRCAISNSRLSACLLRKTQLASSQAFSCRALSCSSFHFFHIPIGSFLFCAPPPTTCAPTLDLISTRFSLTSGPHKAASSRGYLSSCSLSSSAMNGVLPRSDGDYRRFYWAACLSLAVAPYLGFRTEMEHLSVLDYSACP